MSECWETHPRTWLWYGKTRPFQILPTQRRVLVLNIKVAGNKEALSRLRSLMVGSHKNLVVQGKRISNIKVHFNIPKTERARLLSPQLHHHGKVKSFGNFFTFRPFTHHFVFIVFPQSGHVNASGIKDIKFFGELLTCFAECSNTTRLRPAEVIIDNITASGRFSSSSSSSPQKEVFNLPRLFQLPSLGVFKASLRPHLFPSALLRARKASPSSAQDRLGSVILFSNGKFVIVGSRSLFSVAITLAHLHHVGKHLT